MLKYIGHHSVRNSKCRRPIDYCLCWIWCHRVGKRKKKEVGWLIVTQHQDIFLTIRRGSNVDVVELEDDILLRFVDRWAKWAWLFPHLCCLKTIKASFHKGADVCWYCWPKLRVSQDPFGRVSATVADYSSISDDTNSQLQIIFIIRDQNSTVWNSPKTFILLKVCRSNLLPFGLRLEGFLWGRPLKFINRTRR